MQQGGWQASLLEQRLAWGVAAGCIVLAVLAAHRPEWFDFSAPAPEPAAEQTRIAPSLPLAGRDVSAVSHSAAVAKKPAPAEPTVVPTRSDSTRPGSTRTESTQSASSRSAHARVEQSRPPAPAAAIAPGYYVQLGAFQQRARARGLADQLRRHGWHAVVVVARAGGLHAVWAGPNRTRAAAESQQAAIQRKLRKRGFIVRRK